MDEQRDLIKWTFSECQFVSERNSTCGSHSTPSSQQLQPTPESFLLDVPEKFDKRHDRISL